MSYKSKEFKELQREWYEKLKEAGFEDAEKDLNGELVLKYLTTPTHSHVQNFRGIYRKSMDEIREKESYFEGLTRRISNSPQDEYEDDSDRLIMERTAEGKSIKSISDELKSKSMIKHNRDTIRYIRRRYETKWGIKIWTSYEMTSRKIKKKLPTQS